MDYEKQNEFMKHFGLKFFKGINFCIESLETGKHHNRNFLKHNKSERKYNRYYFSDIPEKFSESQILDHDRIIFHPENKSYFIYSHVYRNMPNENDSNFQDVKKFCELNNIDYIIFDDWNFYGFGTILMIFGKKENLEKVFINTNSHLKKIKQGVVI